MLLAVNLIPAKEYNFFMLSGYLRNDTVFKFYQLPFKISREIDCSRAAVYSGQKCKKTSYFPKISPEKHEIITTFCLSKTRNFLQ